jgi:hypothetical protein
VPGLLYTKASSIKQTRPPFEAVMHEEIGRHVHRRKEEKEEELERLRHAA